MEILEALRMVGMTLGSTFAMDIQRAIRYSFDQVSMNTSCQHEFFWFDSSKIEH